jgi:hypothetical protein
VISSGRRRERRQRPIYFDLLLCGVVILEAKVGAHFDGGNLKFKADY